MDVDNDSVQTINYSWKNTNLETSVTKFIVAPPPLGFSFFGVFVFFCFLFPPWLFFSRQPCWVASAP